MDLPKLLTAKQYRYSRVSSAPSFSSDLLNISQQDILGFMDTFDKLDDAGIFEEIDKIEDI